MQHEQARTAMTRTPSMCMFLTSHHGRPGQVQESDSMFHAKFMTVSFQLTVMPPCHHHSMVVRFSCNGHTMFMPMFKVLPSTCHFQAMFRPMPMFMFMPPLCSCHVFVMLCSCHIAMVFPAAVQALMAAMQKGGGKK